MAKKIGIVGIGDISSIYLENITHLFREIEVHAVIDLIEERSLHAYEKYSIPKLYKKMDDFLADEKIDIVLNLTRPDEHFDVTKAALLAGKHVYTEKPLGISMEEGRELAGMAAERGLLLGGAPDTFLGAGIQTCRKIIDLGLIGDIVALRGNMLGHGHETWHPDPEFFYKKGGGPILDMGPYYITAMLNLAGPVKKVYGAVKKTFEERTITSKPFYGQKISVDVPTHVTGVLHFESGALGTLTTSFDSYYSENLIEVFGTEGTLVVPDPNTFWGPVKLRTAHDDNFREIPLMFDYAENSRGLGLADMAASLEKGRAYRANSALVLHTLEIMTAFEKSSDSGKLISIESQFERSLPMQPGLLKGVLES